MAREALRSQTYSDDDDEPTQIEEMMETRIVVKDSHEDMFEWVDRSTAARGDTSNENISVKQSNNRRNAFPNVNCPAQTRSMTNSFFRRHWEHLVQTADNMSRKINAGILLLATYPGAMAAKAYTSPGFQQHVPVYQRIQQFMPPYTAFYCSSFGISELKRLNDCYIVGVGGSNLQTAAAQNDDARKQCDTEDHDIQLHDEMKDSFEASLLSFKNILDEFDKKLTDIAEKLDSSFESGSGHYLAFRKTHRRLADPNALENQQAFLPKNKEGLEVLLEVTQGLCHLEELTDQDLELITALQSAGVHL
ncbi:hypothetical protein BC829DRAFT_415547 [Chytridium lagenaria]|nr:hypothetical protein BC829DRAFT_415547 [Chytridium lagenaria]